MPRAALSGTIQNDILKEFMVRNTYIYPPEPSMRIVADIIAYTAAEMPKFNSISISGYHMQEAGANLGAGAGLHAGRRQGIRARGDRARHGRRRLRRAAELLLRHRHELLHGGGEAARGAAAVAPDHGRVRREEAREPDAAHPLPDQRGVACRSRIPTTTSCAPPTRRWRRCWAARRACTPIRFDEAIALPTEFSARIARNTQLILQHETGVTKVVDPLAGSYYVEALTAELARGGLGADRGGRGPRRHDQGGGERACRSCASRRARRGGRRRSTGATR